MPKKFTVVAIILAALSVLAACGNDDDTSAHETHTAASGEEFNDADVEFASDMIQHHAQALAMVDLTIGRQLDRKVQQLAEGIREAQGPEIEQMTDLLGDWDQPIPATVRDHANAHRDGETEMDTDMPGMMSAAEMADLEAAKGAEFQQMWLEMMIEHHEGAIEKAQIEQTEGHHADAIELAENIESAQQDEISAIETMLGRT